MRLVVAALVLVGCDHVTLTAAMSARVNVLVTDTHIALELELRDDSDGVSGAPYYIDPDEHVIAWFRDESLDLPVEVGFQSGRVTYQGRFHAPADGVGADEEIGVRVERTDESIVVAGVTPPPLSITAPEMVSTDEDVTIAWSPITADPMSWHTGSSCDESHGPVRDESGMITIPSGIVFHQYCSELVLVRSRTTIPETPLNRATVLITREHSVSVMVTP